MESLQSTTSASRRGSSSSRRSSVIAAGLPFSRICKSSGVSPVTGLPLRSVTASWTATSATWLCSTKGAFSVPHNSVLASCSLAGCCAKAIAVIAKSPKISASSLLRMILPGGAVTPDILECFGARNAGCATGYVGNISQNLRASASYPGTPRVTEVPCRTILGMALNRIPGFPKKRYALLLCYTSSLMARIVSLECSKCGARVSADEPRTICPQDGGSLYVRYDLESLRGRYTPAMLAGHAASMWRYSEVLPDAEPVSLGEGFTPLLRSRQYLNV